MSQRITIEKLISYVESIASTPTVNYQVETKEQPRLEHDMIVEQKGVTSIDKLKFQYLEHRETAFITDFPPKLKTMFEPFVKEVVRHGVPNLNKDHNLSFFYSVLFCLMNSFKDLNCEEQQNLINTLRTALASTLNLNGMFDTNGYADLGWKKNDVRETIQKFKSNKMLIQYVSDYLCINIFVVSVLENRLYASYSESTFNMYKMNIFLSFYDDQFEPLELKGETVVDYKNPVYKKVVNVNKQFIHCMVTNLSKDDVTKTFEIGLEDLEKYLKPKQEAETEPEPEVVNEEKVVEPIVKQEEVISVNLAFTTKTKLEELQKIATHYELSFILEDKTKSGKIKYKTKQMLIEELTKIKNKS